MEELQKVFFVKDKQLLTNPSFTQCATRPFADCTARQCSPLRRKFKDCSIISPASLSLFMKHLVIDQRQKIPNFSAFHWSPHRSLVSINQHFVATRVVHLPKRTETSLITESDLITESEQAVRTLHSCNSWLLFRIELCKTSDSGRPK